ncbi:MAG: hypothetical protein ABI610_01735, partial [Acidobacteriota bacterium]
MFIAFLPFLAAFRFAQLTLGSARRVPSHNALKRERLRAHWKLICEPLCATQNKVIGVTPEKWFCRDVILNA